MALQTGAGLGFPAREEREEEEKKEGRGGERRRGGRALCRPPALPRLQPEPSPSPSPPRGMIGGGGEGACATRGLTTPFPGTSHLPALRM